MYINKIDRRSFLKLAAGAGLLAGSSNLSFSKQAEVIKLNVGFPVGGPADTIARLVAKYMANINFNVIVENKPGASGQLAADYVKRGRAADGIPLLVSPSTILSLVPHLYKNPMYDSLLDFVPVGYICDHSFGLAVAGNSPINTINEFIEEAKKLGKNATYATAGSGTGMHLLGTMFSKETGVPLTHVAYRGTAPGLQDVIGGHVFSTFNPLPTMLELHRAGKLKILAVTNPERVSNLPEVPTFGELGLSELELLEWYGVFASSKLKHSVLEEMRALLDVALQNPGFMESARKLELEPRHTTVDTLTDLLKRDYKKWGVLVNEAGISLDA